MKTSEMVLPESLRAHQLETAIAGIKKGFFGIFHDMGAGKTYTSITIMRNLFRKHHSSLRTLIICPDVVIENWASEIDTWSLCGKFVQTLTGPGKKRIKTLEESDNKIFITNFEALHMDGLFFDSYENPKKNAKKKKLKKLIDRKFDILIVDESHRVKNPSADSTKILIKMADLTVYRYILTGTPIPNSLMDIWSQFRIMDRGETFGDNFYDFRKKYFYDENINMPSQKHFPKWFLKAGSKEIISDKIKSVSHRVTKDECLDLPPLIKSIIHTHLSPEQAKAYKSMAKDFISYVSEDDEFAPAVAEIALTKILRMLQIVSGHVKNDEDIIYKFKSVPRLKVLSEILVDIPHKVIVWTTFKDTYEDIALVCMNLGMPYTYLTGAQNTREKARNVHEFQVGEAQVLIANPAAGGTGINLTAAETSIWYMRNYSSLQREQALSRNHRGGSEIHTKINSIDIVTPNTIDEVVLAALDSKVNSAKLILDVKNKLQNELT